MQRRSYPHQDFPTAIVKDIAHRPWALPTRPWVMTQTWHDLLFAHWPISAQSLRPHIPPAFEIEQFEGQAWLGIVPFYMTNVALRGLPALPWLSHFPELNVRTYVRAGGKPGVYFFSLDAASALAVRAARLLGLPYYSASMSVHTSSAGVHYRSRRRGMSSTGELVATYDTAGRVFNAHPATLEYFLTERYCLYGLGRSGRPYRLEIHHPPWSLQRAEAVLTRNTMAEASGIALPEGPPLLHFARRQDTVAWWPESL